MSNQPRNAELRVLRLIFIALCVLIGQGFVIAVMLGWIVGEIR